MSTAQTVGNETQVEATDPEPTTANRTIRASDHIVPAMLNKFEVAAMLNCSWRHVYRLSDEGRMPRPLKLGSLVRWPRKAIEEWIAADCPTIRAIRGGRN